MPGADLLIGEVAALLGVRTSTLRVREAAGLLSPRRERATGYRHYTPDEVHDARFVLAVRRNHYLLDHIRPVLDDLRHEGGTNALRTAVTTRHTTLTTRTAAMLEGAAHLHAYLTPPAQPVPSADAGVRSGTPLPSSNSHMPHKGSMMDIDG